MELIIGGFVFFGSIYLAILLGLIRTA